MRISCLALAAVAVSGFCSVPAVAQEAYDWGGFYAGVFGGFSNGGADYLVTDTLLINPDLTSNPDLSGLFGGVNLGVNYQMYQGFVIGAEADIAAADISGTADVLSGGVPVGGTATTDITSMGALRARVGFAFDRFLPFATAGLAVARTNQSLNAGGLALETLDETKFGWTVGAGLEYAVTDAVSVKAEYRYTQFDGDDVVSSVFPGGLENLSIHTHDVRLGVNYQF